MNDYNMVDVMSEAMEDYENSPYEKVYNKDGFPVAVPCDVCAYSYIVYVDGQYTCPNCWKTFSRQYVFNWSEMPYHQQCLKCKENLGNCYHCSYGYLND